ncbi:hypothetical protein RJJ65_32070 [Rhizobium hidalgonense]|uniref:Uncharacterized protein n=1 Tax=Rhizobium hidalgonense TaxID=1538159 RepID=A0AAJ2LM38_9HYPH|nr:hypothetical protein [Rhizobium hidalgonense]MDR9777195.1 hypothetical protein [Rhizobium hidalgonense]
MPTYEIEMNGQQYEVEAPDDAAASKAIQGLQSPKKTEQSTGMDMLKAAGSGVAQGALDLVGLPGTIQNAFDQSFSKVTGDVASLWGGKGIPAPPPSQLSGEQLRKGVAYLTGGATEYKPETTAGEYTQTAASFVPGAVALGGSGNVVGNAVKYGVVPGLTSEGAGQLAHEYAPSLEPYARFAGAVAGGLIPSGLRAMFPSADDAALAEIVKAAKSDNLTPEAMRGRLQELGPEGMVADLGPSFQGQTGALANIPGPNNQTIRTALNERNAGANARLNEAIDELGPNVVPSQVQAAISDSQRAVGQQYGPVMENARAVNSEGLANRLEAAVTNTRGPEQQALQRVRSYLDIPGTNVLDPNPQAIFATRQAIDGLLAGEQNPQVIRQLTMARQQVDEMLANAAPGIKDVDAQYAELARQGEALGEGQRALDSGRTAPRPDELATRLTEGAIPQGTAVGPSAVPFRISQGARAEIDRIVGTNKNDVAAMDRFIRGEGDWNRAKLASIFGENKADQLLRVLGNEKTFADTRNFATGNSLTANRLQYQKAYGGSDARMTIPEYYGAGGILGALRGTGVKAVSKIAEAITGARSEARNSKLADLLTGREEVVDAVLQSQLRGNRLTGPAKQALVEALLDQKRRLEGQSGTTQPSLR